MYYISQKDSKDGYYLGVKRLRDYLAKDGVEYYVRTSKKPLDFADVVPIYIGKDGKLKKTDSLATMWF